MATATKRNTRKTTAKSKVQTKDELVEKMKAIALEPETKVEPKAKQTKEATTTKKEESVEPQEVKKVVPTEEANTKEIEEVSVDETEKQDVVEAENDETIDENDLPFIDEMKNDNSAEASCSDETEKPKQPKTYENMFGYKWMGWGYTD